MTIKNFFENSRTFAFIKIFSKICGYSRLYLAYSPIVMVSLSYPYGIVMVFRIP